MSVRVSPIQRQTTTTTISDAYHHEEQRQHDAGNREREAEGGEHREIGRAGQVHGLAGRRRLGAAGVDVLVLVGHQ